MLSIEWKDIIYLGCLLVSVASMIITINFKTKENKAKIENLKEQFSEHKIKTDKIHEDLTEVKGLLMEIKGFLKIK